MTGGGAEAGANAAPSRDGRASAGLTVRGTVLLLCFAAAPRLLLFPFAENVAGDAVVRAWLGHAWLEHPRFIGSSLQGCLQFGPLHIVLVGLAEWLTGSLHHGGRWLSLLVGTLSVLPLYALTRRLVSHRAGLFTALAFSLWPLHLQVSTTAASEALSTFLVLLAVAAVARGLESGERPVLLGGALALTLAAAVRYDVWLWIPLLAALVWWRGRSFTRALAFGAVAASFPVAWLLGHLVDTGDLLAPLRLIDEYHREWFRSEAAMWGEARYRLIVASFWPLTALVTLTPPLAVLGGLALKHAWRGPARWLVVLIVASAGVLAVRGAVLSSFVPLSRFTLKELSLFLVFVGAALARLETSRPRVAVALVALLVAWLPGLELAARAEWRWANSFRAVSPLSLNDEPLRVVARHLRAHARPDDVVAVDVDPEGFDDLQLAFESGLPFSQVARRRAPSFEAFAAAGPRWLVRFDGGVLTEASLPGPWLEAVRAGPITLLQRAP